MTEDQYDDAEISFMTEFAYGMNDINSRKTDGSQKSGLTDEKTRELAKRIASSGRKNPTRTQSNSPIPSIPEATDDDSLKPIEITEDMLNDADFHNADISPPLHNQINQQQEPVQEQPQVDDRQMSFEFDVVKAEDVYNMMYDVLSELKKLRKEVKEIRDKPITEHWG